LAFIYETTVNPDDPNSSHALTLALVGFNKRVLEVGCATGFFTRALVDRGCQVVGIEVDADAAAVASEWAERIVVGDLDAGTLWSELEGEQFDAITFGDVLEHLRDPLSTLRAAVRYLKPSGLVAISVPNIAHGDVRMALLHGEFPYRETGLLDRTHVRFFTKSSLRELIREAGLVWLETRRTVVPLFQTELAPECAGTDQSTVAAILQDTEAETYQFVIKAVLDDGSQALSALAGRVEELDDTVHDEQVRAGLLQKELEKLSGELQNSHQELREARHESGALRQQYDAVLNTKTFRMLAPLRRLYGLVRQRPQGNA
jgi:2-polyprenyl-3-methyl-5-hydroxy-6-metoxy-1,4-benzoquinol methylase